MALYDRVFDGYVTCPKSVRDFDHMVDITLDWRFSRNLSPIPLRKTVPAMQANGYGLR
ncbi:hypothetical protein D805_0024 [Bifidobacterium thermophilum RBL67]|uniref:Uncharacterized protein n=1 Tax=Bifidobacterium thermophilum RBL67 TaxID=1254439 RepID=M4R9Z0_9BIFI|nr:hypothetical protein D805_0024 [Bifidobacterium thermophilum RBL67]